MSLAMSASHGPRWGRGGRGARSATALGTVADLASRPHSAPGSDGHEGGGGCAIDWAGGVTRTAATEVTAAASNCRVVGGRGRGVGAGRWDSRGKGKENGCGVWEGGLEWGP